MQIETTGTFSFIIMGLEDTLLFQFIGSDEQAEPS